MTSLVVRKEKCLQVNVQMYAGLLVWCEMTEMSQQWVPCRWTDNSEGPTTVRT